MAKNNDSLDRLASIEARIDADELLNEEQREKIKQRAREHVRKKLIEKETDRLFDLEVKRAELELNTDPNEEILDITINLPKFAYMMSIDGVAYFHGMTYEVPRRQYVSMIDQMARSWEHDRETHGENRREDLTRQHTEYRLSGRTNTTRSLRNSAP